MKAGKNTPQSVLRYIDAVWERSTEPDPIQLAYELGYDAKGIRKLKERHGEGMLAHLLEVKRNRSEVPRFMARQQGQSHPQQYVSSHHGAIDPDEAVDPFTQRRLTQQARDRERGELEQMICAMEDVRSALDERMRMSPDLAKEIGKELWQIRGRIDAAKKRLKRRMAA